MRHVFGYTMRISGMLIYKMSRCEKLSSLKPNSAKQTSAMLISPGRISAVLTSVMPLSAGLASTMLTSVMPILGRHTSTRHTSSRQTSTGQTSTGQTSERQISTRRHSSQGQKTSEGQTYVELKG